MSYRIHLENDKGESFQILGNNEYADGLKEWIEFEGGTVDEDNCFLHKIKDLNKLIEIFENYIVAQDKWRSKEPYSVDIFNLRPNNEIAKRRSLTYRMLHKIEDGIIFVSAQTILFFEESIIKELYYGGQTGKTKYLYKIKEGRSLYIKAG